MSQQSTLSTLLTNQQTTQHHYQQRIQTINHTRSTINDQLQLLQLNYDKKIKQLEHKLEQLKTNNQTLIKQNQGYKSDIDSYQSRLVEKEKIIAMLLGQRKEYYGIGGNSSDPSRSDKTDSVHNQEEKQQGKLFKKQPNHNHKSKENLESASQPVKKQTIEPDVFREETRPNPGTAGKSENQPEVVPQQEERTPPKPPKIRSGSKLPPNRPTPKILQPPLQPQEEEDHEESHLKQDPPVLTARPTPPPPPPRKGAKAPPKKKRQAPKKMYADHYAQEEIKPAPDVNYHQVEPEADPVHQSQELGLHATSRSNEQTGKSGRHQYAFWESTHTEVKQKRTEEAESHNRHEEQEEAKEDAEEEEEFNNNFLSHFTKPHQQQEQDGAPPMKNPAPPPLPVKKAKPQKANPVEQEESSSADFFTQLAREQPGGHPGFEVEESSIDHIERDNSVMSSEQQYFGQGHSENPDKSMRMPKKRGRREIKVVDPSTF